MFNHEHSIEPFTFIPRTLEPLRPFLDKDRTFDCSDENPNTWWICLEQAGIKVEGKIHLGENGLKKIVVYVPGIPGDTVGRFEHDYVPLLIQDGSSVFVIRHAGLIPNVQETASLISSPKRSERDNLIIGTDESNTAKVSDLLDEAFTALSVLGETGECEQISVVSHSAGSYSAEVGLIKILSNRPEIAQKIRKWVTVAGVPMLIVNKDTYDAVFSEQTYSLESYEDAVPAINQSNGLIQSSGHLLNALDIIAINHPEDRDIPLDSAKALLALADTGLLLEDRSITQEQAKKQGLGDVHNFNHAAAINLLKILRMRRAESPHHRTIGSEDGKKME